MRARTRNIEQRKPLLKDDDQVCCGCSCFGIFGSKQIAPTSNVKKVQAHKTESYEERKARFASLSASSKANLSIKSQRELEKKQKEFAAKMSRGFRPTGTSSS